ncbi:hypothetical protein M885DRAFT_507725 [Pelagophyceae sp. CCMP2097]|nr:hypothetical protein M885DRAFT_507725 [Pelagophyceae sp. CCMP2097]
MPSWAGADVQRAQGASLLKHSLSKSARLNAGAVHAVFGSLPHEASAPRLREGEGVVVQLSKGPPIHCFALVLQKTLTLTPVSSAGSVGRSMKRRPRPPDKKALVEEDNDPSSSEDDRAPTPKSFHRTAATPKTAAYVDGVLRFAFDDVTASSDGSRASGDGSRASGDGARALDDARPSVDPKPGPPVGKTSVDKPKKEDAPSKAEPVGSNLKKGRVEVISLARVHRVSVQNGALQRAASDLRRREFRLANTFAARSNSATEDLVAAADLEKPKAGFEFADEDLEKHSHRITLTLGEESFEIVTYSQNGAFAGEVESAHAIELVRARLGLQPSRVTATAALLVGDEDAVAIIADLEDAVCGPSVEKTVEETPESRARSRGARAMATGLYGAEDCVLKKAPGVNQADPAGDAALFNELESDILVDVNLKRAFFDASARLLPQLFEWIASLESDVSRAASFVQRTNVLAIRGAGAQDFTDARKMQLAYVDRAAAALRLVTAALHDARGVSERFSLLRLQGWPLQKLVQILTRDLASYSDAGPENDSKPHAPAHVRATPPRARAESAVQATARARQQALAEFFADAEDTPEKLTRQRLSTPAGARAEVTARHFFQKKIDAPVVEDDARSVSSTNSTTNSNASSALFQAAADHVARTNAAKGNPKKKVQPIKTSTAHVQPIKTSTAHESRLVAAAAAALIGDRAHDDDDCSTIASNASDAPPRTPVQVTLRGAAVDDAARPRERRPPRAFFKDVAAAGIAFADVPVAFFGQKGVSARCEKSAFSALLDAQLALILSLDDLTTALHREDSTRTRGIAPHQVVSQIARRDAAPFLEQLVERAIGLTLKMARSTPDNSRKPRRSDRLSSSKLDRLSSSKLTSSSQGLAEVALLSTSRLLTSVLRTSPLMRDVAAFVCVEELEDYLARPHFYQALQVSNLTRLAATHLREATAMVLAAEERANRIDD